MTDILADYCEWRAQQPERISTHSDRCHMWHEQCMIHRLAAEVLRLRQSDKAEIERLRMTRYERHCIERVRDTYADEDDVACNEIAAVLDGLLERTK